MATEPVVRSPVPVTVITGALGVGKTTALLDALHHAPPGERWAVLVNEFGKVGIDGAVIEGMAPGSVAVREVAGGCICCSAGLELRVGLVRLLREVRPDRLFIEPSGIARPAAVIDALRSPGLREVVSPRAVITLVDPRQFLDPDRRAHETYADQVLLGDVLVANRCDEVGEEVLERFRAEAGALYPPKVVVAETSFGRLDPAWLDLRPSPSSRLGLSVRPDFVRLDPPRALPVASGEPGPGAYHDALDDVEGFGWVWPATARVDRGALQEVVQQLVHPGPAAPEGLLRLKGVFRTDRVTLLVQADPTQVRMEPIDWRRDSRVEVIAPAGTAREDALAAAFEGCLAT